MCLKFIVGIFFDEGKIFISNFIEKVELSETPKKTLKGAEVLHIAI